jgi:mRNA interferase MazF
MTHYNRGDVVLVPFPFSDQTTAKKRPAVIISSSTYNDTSRETLSSWQSPVRQEVISE